MLPRSKQFFESLDERYCYRNSVRLSVCLSVTLVIHAETVQYIDACCAPRDRVMFLF